MYPAVFLTALAVASCGRGEAPPPDPAPASWSVSCESLNVLNPNGDRRYNLEASVRAIGASVTAVEFVFGDGSNADVVMSTAGEAPQVLTASTTHPYPQLSHEVRYAAQVGSIRVQLPDNRIISVAGSGECQRVIVVPAAS